MPPGRSAILLVWAPPAPDGVMSLGSAHATVYSPTADSSFAQMVAKIASEEGGVEVMQPFEVAARLKAAGITPTLQPDGRELENLAAALGCDSYMTGVVHEWWYSYTFFWTKAVVSFELYGRVPGRYGPIWTVKADYVRKGIGAGDTAALALTDAFRKLAAQGLVPGKKKTD